MVTNLTKDVIDLKNDNTLLKQEIKDLHSLIEVSLRPTSQYITGEQRILPASIQRVPSAALPSKLLRRPCRTGTWLLLEFHPLDLQRCVILTDLKPLLTERRRP
jgi:hypothetical protein